MLRATLQTSNFRNCIFRRFRKKSNLQIKRTEKVSCAVLSSDCGCTSKSFYVLFCTFFPNPQDVHLRRHGKGLFCALFYRKSLPLLSATFLKGIHLRHCARCVYDREQHCDERHAQGRALKKTSHERVRHIYKAHDDVPDDRQDPQ